MACFFVAPALIDASIAFSSSKLFESIAFNAFSAFIFSAIFLPKRIRFL